MNIRSLKQIVAIAGLTLLVSCGNGGGSGFLGADNNNNNNDNNGASPYISAGLTSFPTGSDLGFLNAVVMVQNAGTKADITTATVTINDVLLTYNPDSGHKAYEGSVLVAPGETIKLSVTILNQTYTVSTPQFTSYPTISMPVAGVWHASVPNTITWSGGAPATNAVYNLAILDAHNPYGDLAWPTDSNNMYLVQPIDTTSYSIPANSVSVGDRYMFVGIVTNVSIPRAASGSKLYIGGCSYVPITIVDSTLTAITITPKDPSMPAGTTQQFTAIGTFSDTTTQDLTRQVSWSSNQLAVTMDYSSFGIARAQYVGTSTITASLAGIFDTTSATVPPPSLLSIEVSPSNREIARDTAQHFKAVGSYSDGSAQTITSSVTWSSSNTDVATISNETGSNGITTAVSNGTATIGATLNGISASAGLTVTDVPSIAGNYVYLQSDTGDLVGSGKTYTFSQANDQITVSAAGGNLSVNIEVNRDWWNLWRGNFVVPNSLTQLQTGSYGNLTRYPFNDPAVGGLNWNSPGMGCNALTGSFVINNVTYSGGNLTAIDLCFEQHCEGWSPALYGWIHWTQ